MILDSFKTREEAEQARKNEAMKIYKLIGIVDQWTYIRNIEEVKCPCCNNLIHVLVAND